MYETMQALVLREVRYKESDRIINLLTRQHGKMSAKARGALRKGSKTAAATQQLTYSEGRCPRQRKKGEHNANL